MFGRGAVGTRKLWHRKARWMLRKVILNPPTSEGQMRNLCNEIIERRHGTHSPPTAAIVSTALSLWDDPNLVNALENNPAYKSARERIHRTASHILPTSEGGEGNEGIGKRKNLTFLKSTQQVLEKQFHDVLKCPVCGLNLHCHHEHNSSSAMTNTKLTQIEEDVEEFGKFSEGSIGRVPEEITETPAVTAPKEISPAPFDWDTWFGPLVLTTFAVFGIAVGVWSGDIEFPKVKSLTSRAVLAVTMMMQASNSLFKLLGQV